MSETITAAQPTPAPRLNLLEDMLLDVPVYWRGGRTIGVRDREGNDAMMTVAPEAVDLILQAAQQQDMYGMEVDLWVDASGLHIVDVCLI